MATVMANARIRDDLKRNGDKVLKKEGATFTGTVTALYEYLVKEQKIPECLSVNSKSEDDAIMRRKKALQNFTGCLSDTNDASLDNVKNARLARQ